MGAKTDRSRHVREKYLMQRGHRWDNSPSPPATVARGQIMAIREETKQAVRVAPEYFYFYQRRHDGRRCSCFVFESSPAGHCTSCYGTGVVGGFEKWGCKTETLDATYPQITMVNLAPNYKLDTKPIMLSLSKDASYGYAEFLVNVPQPNCGLDMPPVVRSKVPSDTTLAVFVKVPGEVEWVTLNEEAIKERAQATQLLIRVWMARENPNTEVPHLANIMLRWQRRKDIMIPADVPRISESKTLEELGIFDSYDEISAALDVTLPNITTDDFFHHLRMCKRWKVVTIQPNAPQGINTAWDGQVRLVQDFEPMADIP